MELLANILTIYVV